MSIKLMTAAWALDLSPTDKLVLLALSDWANDDGHCWPSLSKLQHKSCLSERAIRNALRALEAAGHLSRQEVPGRGVNYTIHPGTSCPPAADAPGTSCPPPRQQVPPTPARRAPNTLENHQNTSVSPPTAGFDAFWQAYPRREGKQHALKAWAKATKAKPADAIISAAKRYASAKADTDRQFIKQPATWLNGGCWDDELPSRPDGSNSRSVVREGFYV